MKEEVHATFRGRVQGVGFRATARYYASELKLHGFARNLADGTVEVCAQGGRKELELLIQKLKQEFNGCSLDAPRYCAPTEEYSSFRVL